MHETDLVEYVQRGILLQDKDEFGEDSFKFNMDDVQFASYGSSNDHMLCIEGAVASRNHSHQDSKLALVYSLLRSGWQCTSEPVNKITVDSGPVFNASHVAGTKWMWVGFVNLDAIVRK